MSLRVSQGPGLPQGILLCVRKSNCQACVPVNVTLSCSQRACLAGVLATMPRCQPGAVLLCSI